ncbi:MAG: ABC transporter permease [Clostridia bacterium]
MNILLLYFKKTLRDKMFLLIMILFPVVLIWILGNAFSGIMGGGESTGNAPSQITMLYKTLDESPASAAFESHMAGENEYFILIRMEDEDEALNMVRTNRYAAFVTVSGGEVTIYKNSRYNFYSSLGELIMKTFVDDYNLIYEILSIDPMMMEGIGAFVPEKITSTKSIVQDRQPNSMDYYGVTITTMFILYGIIFMGTYIAGDRGEKTLDRILVAPVKSSTYQWGVLTGNTVVLMLQLSMMILLGILVFRVYWGDALGISLLVMACQVVMACALGALLGLTMKNEELIAGIAQVAIPAFVFLGDGYVSIPAQGVFLAIKKMSPVYWVNHAIFDAIYSQDHSKAFVSMGISLGITALCTLLILLHNRNRRVRHE